MNLPKTFELIESGIERGLHLGAQVYVSVEGDVVADGAVGLAWDAEDSASGEDEPLRTDHLALWLSACKPVGAVAIAQLWEQGRVDLDAPVAEIIPEFARHGKAPITLRHILTHTGGFRESALDMIEPDWDTALRKVYDAPLEEGWTIGETAGYHERSSWYVLGEVVRRVDGRPYWRYVREAIFEPLGMADSWIGMPAERYRAYGERIAPVYYTFRGARDLLALHGEPAVTSCLPAGNGRGPVRELGWFYEALLNGGERNGARVLDAATVAEFTRRHRAGTFDKTMRHTMDWGLGFIVDSKQYGARTVPYGYGLHASERTFGHGGRQSVAGFADPERGLAVAIWFNGLPGEPKHNQRIREVATAIYEDLDLA